LTYQDRSALARRVTPARQAAMYKWQHLIENFFGRIQKNRGIAMRSCKTDTSYIAFFDYWRAQHSTFTFE